jgi:hypothetical protein
MEVDSQVTIYLHCCSKIELFDWNLPVILVADIEYVPGQDVVMDFLRSPAILEDKCDRFIVVRGLCCSGPRWLRRIRDACPWWRLLIVGLIVVARRYILRGSRTVIACFVWTCKKVWRNPQRGAIPINRPVMREIWPAEAG